MVDINPRLNPLFEVFCEKNCKYFSGRLCRKNRKEATLMNCPIGEWWDVNDYLNEVNKVVNMIKERYDVKKPTGKLKDIR